ncbi:MAG: DUF1015 domain-containing protein [Planctomycetota bacterium]
MPEITPFCGLRYNPQRFANQFSELIAPPYDVLDADDKTRLLNQHNANIVAIDLPHVPPNSAGPDQVYSQAAKLLDQWQTDHTLICDHKPTIYVYHQIYENQGQKFIRQKFFARMRLEELGQGSVYGHENTFSGPKQDRLKLMQATKCQLSAIFALYSDPENTVSKILKVKGQEPDMMAELDGVTNNLWVVQDTDTVKAVQKQLADRPVYIADGHHRYGTAMIYRDKVLAENSNLPMDHPARFVLMGLCAMEDPGALILPTHRVISNFGKLDNQQILAALKNGLNITPADDNITDPKQLLPDNSSFDLGIYTPADGRMYKGKFTKQDIVADLEPEQSPAWQNLDLVYLHRYLIDELITQKTMGGNPPKVHCCKSIEKTIDKARQTNGIALFTRACTMEQLRNVSNAGNLMPQKSTFFYPKLATGMVINPLE